MVKRIAEQELGMIEGIVRAHSEGLSAAEIARELGLDLPRRTLQHRLKRLVEDKRLVREGEKRGVRYRVPGPPDESGEAVEAAGAEAIVPLSEAGAAIRAHLRRPLAAREPVGYDRGFLETYRPNVSAYLSEDERAHLREIGTVALASEPAGTYAKRILDRLLIDLSWNSSRLEGNTYSLLDTRRLIAFGREAEGKARLEAQMILNHKDAIEFLVGSAEEIGFNRHTLLNLHALLAHNLLPDPQATGRLRHVPVGIEQSVFHPLEVPQLIEDCFDRILTTASAVADPFEQAFFVMVQLPYLQPFDDVNKRVSRLAANIPLIRANLTPLSFAEVPKTLYGEAVLGVYELERVDLLKDVFVWAYERSAARHAAVRQSLGEPDPFRLKHRDALRQIVGEIVRRPLGRESALGHITAWAEENIEPDEREAFAEIVESELLGLHDGNYARYRIRPSEFRAWLALWNSRIGKAGPA